LTRIKPVPKLLGIFLAAKDTIARTPERACDLKRGGRRRRFLQERNLDTREPEEPATRQEEWRTFLFLTVVTAPLLSVIIVGGYGFLVWMYQLITGDLPG
jgi:nitrate reductase NapE